MSRSTTGALDLTESIDAEGQMIAGWLAVAYVILIALGAVALRLPGVTIRGNEMSPQTCIFTSINAATMTGFQQAVSMDQYATLGKIEVTALFACGTLLTLMIGGIGLNCLLGRRYTNGQIISTTLFVYVFFIGCAMACLLDATRGLFASATQAASAIGNCGLSLGPLPGATDWRTHAVLLPLAMIGGLSIPVLLEIKDAIVHRVPMSVHSRTVLALLAGVYLIGVLLLTPWLMTSGESGTVHFAHNLAIGSMLSINARSCGFPMFSPAALGRATQWLLIGFMMIGAAPGGASGGMKVTSLFHAFRGTHRVLDQQPSKRITGIALAWIGGYVLLVFLTQLALLAASPSMAADRLLMLSASAIGNVGLSHEPVTATGASLLILSLAMLIGRAMPLMVLWWAAMTTSDVDVAIG